MLCNVQDPRAEEEYVVDFRAGDGRMDEQLRGDGVALAREKVQSLGVMILLYCHSPLLPRYLVLAPTGNVCVYNKNPS